MIPTPQELKQKEEDALIDDMHKEMLKVLHASGVSYPEYSERCVTQYIQKYKKDWLASGWTIGYSKKELTKVDPGGDLYTYPSFVIEVRPNK